MRNLLNSIFALLIACGSTLALAADDVAVAANGSEPVSVIWVYFFVVVFFGICGWFAFAIWRADKKSRSALTDENS